MRGSTSIFSRLVRWLIWNKGYLGHSYCTIPEKIAYEKQDRCTIRLWPAALAAAVDAYYSFKLYWFGLYSAPAQTYAQTANASGRPQCGGGENAVTGCIRGYFP